MKRHGRFSGAFRGGALAAACAASTALLAVTATNAAAPKSFLEGIHRQTTLTSTVPENGDQNPYAIVVAPVSAGSIQKDDVLLTNFNNSRQSAGPRDDDRRLSTRDQEAVDLRHAAPQTLRGCPGGVGLITAMTMLKTGWVIVGSAPERRWHDQDQGRRVA